MERKYGREDLVRRLKGNKKGSLADIIFMGVVMLFFSIVVLVGLKVATELNNNFKSNDNIPESGKVAVDATIAKYKFTINNVFLFFTIGMGMVTLILAALVRIHPIFIPLYFIGLIFVIFLAAIFSNVYQEIASQPEFSAIASELTFMNTIMIALPFIIGVFGILLMIIMYKLWSVQQ